MHHRKVNDHPTCGGGGGLVMSTCLNEILLFGFRLCEQSRTVNETPKVVQRGSAASCTLTSPAGPLRLLLLSKLLHLFFLQSASWERSLSR